VNAIGSLLYLVDPSGFLSAIFMPAANLLHELPHSRESESEADRIGLELSVLEHATVQVPQTSLLVSFINSFLHNYL
jgi:hypothetical protein